MIDFQTEQDINWSTIKLIIVVLLAVQAGVLLIVLMVQCCTSKVNFLTHAIWISNGLLIIAVPYFILMAQVKFTQVNQDFCSEFD